MSGISLTNASLQHLAVMRKQCKKKKQRLSSLRANSNSFNWQQQCLFCGKNAEDDPKHPHKKEIRIASTLPFHNKVVQFCNEKRKDQWGDEVKRRVINCTDFVQIGARYHKSCHTKFFTYKNPEASNQKSGRKQNAKSHANFL